MHKTPQKSKVQWYCTHFVNRLISVRKCIGRAKNTAMCVKEKQYKYFQNKCSEKIQKVLLALFLQECNIKRESRVYSIYIWPWV